MTVRRFRLALLGTLLLPPLLWAAFRHVRESHASEDLLRSVATAHLRVGYEGEGAWGNQWPGMWIVHNASSGRTRYGSGRWSHVEATLNSRMPDPAAFCSDLDALLENYRAKEGTAGRYLDRDVRSLLVEPRHEGRPRLEILFDAETSLPLRVKTIRPDGSVLREAVFHSIFFGDPEVRESFGTRDTGRDVEPARLDEEAGFAVWRPAYVPEGFRLKRCRISTWMGHCVRLLYTDGVTAFELWQRPILTPAQVETLFARSPGGPEPHVKRHVRYGMRALARSGGAGPEGIAVERRECGPHVKYEMRLEGSDVTFVTRADLGEEEPMRVLRSLVVR